MRLITAYFINLDTSCSSYCILLFIFRYCCLTQPFSPLLPSHRLLPVPGAGPEQWAASAEGEGLPGVHQWVWDLQLPLVLPGGLHAARLWHLTQVPPAAIAVNVMFRGGNQTTNTTTGTLVCMSWLPQMTQKTGQLFWFFLVIIWGIYLFICFKYKIIIIHQHVVVFKANPFVFNLRVKCDCPKTCCMLAKNCLKI